MCPSVISLPAIPGNHIIFSIPSKVLNSASIYCFVLLGLRLLLIMQLSAKIAVPSPSTSIAPPSTTKVLVNLGTLTCSATNLAISLSSSCFYLFPHPLKLKSTAERSPFSFKTNVGPESLSQRSLRG